MDILPKRLISKDICLYIDRDESQPKTVFKDVCKSLNIELQTSKGIALSDFGLGKCFIATILSQGENLKDDLKLISGIKAINKELPIIFYSTRYSRSVEYLIRREGVHFFLLPDFPLEELHLVLKTLLIKGKDPFDIF